ncbi:cell division cycle-associated protein 4 [Alosa sapidissima]|uniref:cell division cycle-associated protein 4 n=1 Tax=Alosa sapidissima TaxID=34773 RepID=UPI001C09D90B|nr:cell division cycle-associated protein 4 [Alosa sapidissima]XP_041950901.1 cell division cycle-associated protein 4 [Alosa sapidissima]XP_041950902.1 cell division cycle-associated protein 4 [Alosa sapidissima]XP_041950903.1 cell division cycle-associated protein 4 [Alosa sapidissima]
MFSKGTKRKFPDGGEELPEEGLPSSNEELASASYSLQRQSLLDMSLIKLQLCHMLVEPNLCRSVLIANTVRQIQEEMTHDGSWQTAAMMEAIAAAGSGCSGVGGPPERLVATEVLCRPGREMTGGSDAEPKLFSVMGYDGCREEEVVAVEEDSICSEAASNVCLSGSMGHCWERGVLRGERELDSRLGAPDEDVDVEEEDEEEEDNDLEGCRDEGEAKATRQVFGTFEIKNSHPGPESALEELFSDVDPSYYDLDTVLTGMQAAPKIGPYDLLDSLSQSHSPSSLGSAANCRSDLNELDHIMEIIVGS